MDEILIKRAESKDKKHRLDLVLLEPDCADGCCYEINEFVDGRPRPTGVNYTSEMNVVTDFNDAVKMNNLELIFENYSESRD